MVPSLNSGWTARGAIITARIRCCLDNNSTALTKSSAATGSSSEVKKTKSERRLMRCFSVAAISAKSGETVCGTSETARSRQTLKVGRAGSGFHQVIRLYPRKR